MAGSQLLPLFRQRPGWLHRLINFSQTTSVTPRACRLSNFLTPKEPQERANKRRKQTYVMKQRDIIRASAAIVLALLHLTVAARAAQGKLVPGHIPPQAAGMQPVGRLSATNRLRLAIGLPLRKPAALSKLLAQLYDPASPNFHQYLTPGRFADTFGPSAADYQAMTNFARSNGLTVVGTHPNRTLLDVTASVADIERAFHLQLQEYRHPQENRRFYAPDREPSPEVDVPLLHISGLDNYVLPHANGHIAPAGGGGTPADNAAGGSGPNGLFAAKDLRTAYVPGVSLNGSGQAVGLVEFTGFPTNDVLNYETNNHLPNVKLTTVPVDGYDESLTGQDYEAAADVELVIALAPGLSQVIVYESLDPFHTHAPPNDLLSRMATDDLANQLSCSWFFDIDANTEQIFQQYAAQGQSFFQSSGDAGAYAGGITTVPHGGPPADDPYITVVGGTDLITSGPGGSWVSETTWSSSGGGVSTKYSIPLWQQGVDMTGNHGSVGWRNTPDVAMIATNIDFYYGGAEKEFDGTSASAPLWAAFTALINQKAASLGNPPVGFLNPALYAIAKGASYSSCFHDITNGNNTNPGSPDRYAATPGYDLCTGWGSPNGASLLNALAAMPRSLVWVAFGGADPGNGSYQRPYNTLARGTSGLDSGGTIIIKGPGSTAETMQIAAPMRIETSGGWATIGR
jgi:subtilase family serine protease